ncbi:cytochrome c biogenesis CcdA family protein [Evansella halocellulosilytica]|uniref:cytochrome c biogenesis CcdA family protein n=1 Tax=Evansella halocellulosilytica TaxID=2011013 RepID=UPI000BB799A1|nr:cytochrome c biogenesis protein CcdA [Evansella halocellulosilytica]
MDNLTIFFAFGAGVLSFVSPCNIPLYPAFISYITGLSQEELKNKKYKASPSAMIHTFIFILGFSTIFIALGMSTSFLGQFFIRYSDLIRQLGAIFIILFGLFIAGWFKPGFLMKTRQYQFSKRPGGFLGSYAIGLAFAAGWTPCIGPILASVISLSLSNPGSGMVYMGVFSIGFSIPFFLMAFFIGKLNWIKKYMNVVMKSGGIIMVIFGVMLYFDLLTLITSFLVNNVFDGFMGF